MSTLVAEGKKRFAHGGTCYGGFVMLSTLRVFQVAVVLSCGLGVLAACSSGEDNGGSDQVATDQLPTGHPPLEDRTAPSPTTVAGVSYMVPEGWIDVGPSGMRKAQFRLDPVEGDEAPAELAVFYFGADQGGSTEANIQRWIMQMSVPDGKSPQEAAEREQMTVNEMDVHIVTLNGTYNDTMGRPGSGTSTRRDGYRLVGLIVDGPQGSVFFKMTGPLNTVLAMEQELRQMVGSLAKSG